MKGGSVGSLIQSLAAINVDDVNGNGANGCIGNGAEVINGHQLLLKQNKTASWKGGKNVVFSIKANTAF